MNILMLILFSSIIDVWIHSYPRDLAHHNSCLWPNFLRAPLSLCTSWSDRHLEVQHPSPHITPLVPRRVRESGVETALYWIFRKFPKIDVCLTCTPNKIICVCLFNHRILISPTLKFISENSILHTHTYYARMRTYVTDYSVHTWA